MISWMVRRLSLPGAGPSCVREAEVAAFVQLHSRCDHLAGRHSGWCRDWSKRRNNGFRRLFLLGGFLRWFRCRDRGRSRRAELLYTCPLPFPLRFVETAFQRNRPRGALPGDWERTEVWPLAHAATLADLRRRVDTYLHSSATSFAELLAGSSSLTVRPSMPDVGNDTE